MPHNDKREIQPFVKPGEPLGYVAALKGRDNWPPKRRDPKPDDRRGTVTPYLVVPTTEGDMGVRPLPASQALYNSSVEIVDSGGSIVTNPVPGTEYTLRCRAINLGAAGAYGGMAEFYIGTVADFDAHASAAGSIMPIFALTGFTAAPGATVTITCPKRWTPQDAAEAESSIVVAVYDAFVDPVTQPFNAAEDRHIGRHDPVPDFSGTWNGLEVFNSSFSAFSGLLQPLNAAVVHAGLPTLMLPQPLPEATVVAGSANRRLMLSDSLIASILKPPLFNGQPVPEGSYLIKMVITQTGLTVNASIFLQVGGVLPAVPQDTGTGTINGGQVQIFTTEFLDNGATPFTSNLFVLSLPDPATLHFTRHTHFLMPGDPRPDMDLHGDLTRL